MLHAEIITIGDELLIGQTVDTNSAWMASELNALGINLYQITSISDEKEHILRSLKECAQRSSVILITGGLGPTKDDITKSTLCEYFDTELQMNHEILDGIVDYFKSKGKAILEMNRMQAMLPKACTALINTRGTASGMWFERNGVVYVSMPGVPYEMKGLMREEVLPRLKEKFKTPAIFHKTIMTQGIGESFLAKKVEVWENSLPSRNLKLAYLPSPGIVKVRISAYGDDEEALKDEVLKATDEFRSMVPEYVYGEDGESLEVIVGRLLADHKKTLSIAESCTGGKISEMITAIAGSSAFFMGSAVTYSNASKVELLGVKSESLNKWGAVSEAVVEEMAVGAQKFFKTDYAIATSGVAGPGGGTEEKPVGLVWIALATPNGVLSERCLFGKNRGRNIKQAANRSLDMLRKEIIR